MSTFDETDGTHFSRDIHTAAIWGWHNDRVSALWPAAHERF